LAPFANAKAFVDASAEGDVKETAFYGCLQGASPITWENLGKSPKRFLGKHVSESCHHGL